MNIDIIRQFVLEKHIGQFDKVGQAYYLHPLRVEQIVVDLFDDAELDVYNNYRLFISCKVAALCHDLLEDTNTTIDDLYNLNIDQDIINALKLLTHNKGVSYDEYIEAISGNIIATIVKIADLEHNMDITRFAGVRELNDVDLKRLNKYLRSYSQLMDIYAQYVKKLKQ